jgi:hypothetical protein
MVRYSFLVRLSHPLLHAGLSRRILDHLVHPREHVRRDRETDLLRCFQVDHELKPRWLLNGKIGGLGAFQNTIINPRPDVKEVPVFPTVLPNQRMPAGLLLCF